MDDTGSTHGTSETQIIDETATGKAAPETTTTAPITPASSEDQDAAAAIAREHAAALVKEVIDPVIETMREELAVHLKTIQDGLEAFLEEEVRPLREEISELKQIVRTKVSSTISDPTNKHTLASSADDVSPFKHSITGQVSLQSIDARLTKVERKLHHM